MLEKENIKLIEQNINKKEEPIEIKTNEDLINSHQVTDKYQNFGEINKQKIRNDELIEDEIEEQIEEQKEKIDDAQKEEIKNEKLLGCLQKDEDRAQEFRRFVNNAKALKKYKVYTLPAKSALMNEYRGVSKSLSTVQRAAKIKNKRSRLFQKAQNFSALENIVKTSTEDTYKMAADACYTLKGISETTIRDLSYFMVQNKNDENAQIENNKNLIKLYTGADEDEELTGLKDGDLKEKIKEDDKEVNRVKALDRITAILLSFDVSKISLESDKDIAKNAKTLEKLTGMVCAYDRLLSENQEYAQSLEGRNEETNGIFRNVKESVDKLRAVACYYVARKELITDKYYREHYNDELGMDVGDNATEDQKRVAKLLINAYYTGRSLMRANIASDKEINKRGTLAILQGFSQNHVNSEWTDQKSEETRRKLLMEYHKKNDSSARNLYDNLPEQRQGLVEYGKSVSSKFYVTEELDKNYKEPGLDELEKEIKDFENIKMDEFRFGTYREMLENYDHNIKLAKKADRAQTVMAKALVSGYKYNDQQLLKLRAKFIAFNEIKATLASMYAFFTADDSHTRKKSFDKWDEYFREKRTFTDRKSIAAIPCSDMNKYYRLCLEHVTKEHKKREQTIEKTWKVFRYQNPNPGELKKLINQKKAEYQKNAFLSDFLMAQGEKITYSNTMRSFAADEFFEEHKELKDDSYQNLVRTGKDYLGGKSKEDTERLIKLISGNDEDKLKFWMEFYHEITDISLSVFEMSPIERFFTNFIKKAHIAYLFSNCEVIGEQIEKLARNLGKKACPILGVQEGEEDEKINEIVRKTNIFKQTAQGYITGRINALTSMPSNIFRHAASIEDICGNIDMKEWIDVASLDPDQVRDLEFTEDERICFGKYQAQIFSCQNYITTRKDQPLKLDSDLTQLYKEDTAAYDVKQFGKKYPGGINNAELKEKLKIYNNAYDDYLETDEAQSLEKEFAIDTENVEKKDKKETIKKIEAVFERILTYKPGQFNFKNYEMLFSEDSVGLRHLAELGEKAGRLYEYYKKQLEEEIKNKGQGLCNLGNQDLVTIGARIEFLKTALKYYGGSDDFTENIKSNEFVATFDLAPVLEEKRRNLDKKTWSDEAATKIAIDKLQLSRYKDEFTYGNGLFEQLKSEKYGRLNDLVKKETKTLGESINKLKALLMYTTVPAPGTKDAEKIVDGTCNLVGICFTQIVNNLGKLKKAIIGKDDLVDKKALTDSIDEIITICKKDQEMFPQKASDFFEIMTGNKVQPGSELRWIEVLKFERAEFYDTDKEGVTVKKAGALQSEISVIKSSETGKTIYFRKEDFSPKADLREAIYDVSKAVFEKPDDDAAKFCRSITDTKLFKYNAQWVMDIGKIKRGLGKIIKNDGKNSITYGYGDAGKDIAILFAKNNMVESDVGDKLLKMEGKELEDFGRFFINFNDMLVKRDNCHGGGSSEKKYNRSAKILPGRNLSNRHAATSRFAQLLGIGHMVSASRTALIKIDNQLVKGNLMEDSKGKEAIDIINECKRTKKEPPVYSTEALKQSLMLQVFDYLIGHVDRHFGNFHMLVNNETNTIEGIRAIDNDMCWGLLTPADLKYSFRHFKKVEDVLLMGLPVEFINKIFSITRENASVMMGDILEEDEINAFMTRVNGIKDRLRMVLSSDEDMEISRSTVPEYGLNQNKEYVRTGNTITTSETVRYKSNKNEDDLRALEAVQGLKRTAFWNVKGITEISNLYHGFVDNLNIGDMIDKEYDKLNSELKSQ